MCCSLSSLLRHDAWEGGEYTEVLLGSLTRRCDLWVTQSWVMRLDWLPRKIRDTDHFRTKMTAFLALVSLYSKANRVLDRQAPRDNNFNINLWGTLTSDSTSCRPLVYSERIPPGVSGVRSRRSIESFESILSILVGKPWMLRKLTMTSTIWTL